jgi:D-alanyl-D-alanine carboxypeptidase/D-alanyl-D-alanine-endopeptidase (penicillin-binding protein 4)
MVARRACLLSLALLAVAGGTPAAGSPVAGPDLPGSARVATAGSPKAASSELGRDRLERKLDRLINQAGPASGAWVYDTEAEDHNTLFAEDGRTDRILASNMKLFTTSTALDRLGKDGRLATGVWADGAIESGVLRGDLYLVGDGDPALASKDFASRNGLPLTPFGRLSREIKDAGVSRVAGSVFADDTIFDRLRGVPDSNWRTSEYIGPLSGLSYNSGYDGGGFAEDPALVAGHALREDLEKRGIGVKGEVRLGDASSRLIGADPLALVHSPQIAALVEETNRVSNNFFAETLLKRLAASGGKRGTTKRGADKVEAFAEREMDTRVHAADGSGLTRSNRASPLQVGKLLVGMLEHPAAEPFRDSLALAGREGTLAERMRGTAAEGSCEAKTGSLSDVSALSGYCRANGRTVAFSILMNSVDVGQARAIQDEMAAAIARYRP